MPLTELQSHVLQMLAAQRSPDSYIAGGVALNREGPRFSAYIDIFQDSEERLLTAAATDAAAITQAGLSLTWRSFVHSPQSVPSTCRISIGGSGT